LSATKDDPVQLWLTLIFLINSLPAVAQTPACPFLEGTFHCRGNPAFDIRVHTAPQGAFMAYIFEDPFDQRQFLTDGALHVMSFSDGKGEYRAACESSKLLVEVHAPDGEIFNESYYIQRAGLVRIRLSKSRAPSVVSCAPTGGTWRYYPH
jgi:hypothetical protein